MIGETLRRHGAGLAWHAAAAIYAFAVVLAFYDAPRVRDILLVWAVGAALLLAIPVFRKYRRATVVIALGVPLAFLAVEIAIRAKYFGVDGLVHPARVRPDPEVTFETMTRRTPLPGGGQLATLTPDMDMWFKGAHLRTNSLGYRNPEFEPRNSQRTRIVVLGDSFTMAWGVAEENSYARQLERILGERMGEGRVEVLNAGFPSDLLSGSVARLRGHALDLDPDLVIVGLTARMVTVRAPRGGSQDSSSIAVRALETLVRGSRTRPEPNVLHRTLFVAQRRPKLEGLEKAAVDAGLFEARTEPLEEVEEERTRGLFDELHAIGESAGIPILIAHLRSVRRANEPTDQGAPAQLRRIAAEARVGFVDTGPAFPPETVALDAVIFPGDNHPNAGAHSAYARAIADAIHPEGGGGLLP